jgi:hypothetical protein
MYIPDHYGAAAVFGRCLQSRLTRVTLQRKADGGQERLIRPALAAAAVELGRLSIRPASRYVFGAVLVVRRHASSLP